MPQGCSKVRPRAAGLPSAALKSIGRNPRPDLLRRRGSARNGRLSSETSKWLHCLAIPCVRRRRVAEFFVARYSGGFQRAKCMGLHIRGLQPCRPEPSRSDELIVAVGFSPRTAVWRSKRRRVSDAEAQAAASARRGGSESAVATRRERLWASTPGAKAARLPSRTATRCWSHRVLGEFCPALPAALAFRFGSRLWEEVG